MKIVFADVPMLDYGVALDGRTPNIGLLSLMATAREAAPETIIRYLDVFHTLESHVDEVRRFCPDLYCLSFTSVYSGRGYETISRVKEAFPGIPVILGGPHVSALPEKVLLETPADVCCVGEGDRTIVDLMNAHSAGMPWDRVPGIVARQGEEIITTPSRPPVPCLDDLPMPAWDLVDFGRFHGLVKIRRSPSTTIIPSRGCPFNCTFCSNPVWNSAKPRLRHRSKESITDLRHLKGRRLLDYISWAFATPYPGSELYRVANQYGLVPPHKKRGEITARQDISMALPGVSRGQMLRSRAKGLFLQGQFVLASEGFFEPANMKQNLRHSANKLWYMVRPW